VALKKLLVVELISPHTEEMSAENLVQQETIEQPPGRL